MKLVCKKSDHGAVNVWRFTEGREYKMHGSIHYDAHVIDDNGLELWLVQLRGVMVGAGVDGYEFVEIKK